MLETFLISLALLGLSGWLLDTHRRSWRRSQADASLSDADRRFARAQYYRRMQASGIIGILGLAIGAEPLVPEAPWPFLVYALSLAAACGCILILAALDAWATRRHYSRIRRELHAAQAKLVQDVSRDDG